MSKVLVIGIDGMDSIQLSKLEEHLPNFKRLKEESPDIKMTSVFPPDSIPAWGSIYTGLNPAQHGIVNFIDPNSEETKIVFKELHKYYCGRAFWDVASESGKKVCVLLPYSIYPPWHVNGVMVCRILELVDENFPLKTYPEEIYDEFNLSDFNVNLFHGFPSKRNLGKFVDACKKRTIDEAELGLRFLKGYDADLYFIYFSALDAIQHTFWNYYDKIHPDYPGENKYQSVIKDFYVLFDEFLGKFLDAADENTTTIVLSDHGHGMRPVKLVNINEILRRKGLLISNIKNKRFGNPIQQKEKLKKVLANLVSIVGVGNVALKLIERFPMIKNTIGTPNYINWEETVAYISAISGIKSYSEGGVMINKNVKDVDYERVRESVIKELSDIQNPVTGDNLMKWICNREDLYNGEYITKYPDIVFELKGGFGVGWDINGEIIGKSSMSRFQPGSHLRSSPVFLVSNLGDGISVKEDMVLMDLKAVVLEVLGVEVGFDK
jgi:predicted AlkP superfamily phosphohydrolase/phosphomutase